MQSKLLPIMACAVLLAGCESKAGTGALVGAGGGALIGGLAGGGTGALIGGAAGAVGGALIGYALDEHDRAVMAEKSPRTLDRIDRRQQLTVEDVKNMSKNGLSDDTITRQIDATQSVFRLSSSDIIGLKKAGVSEYVINYMIETGD